MTGDEIIRGGGLRAGGANVVETPGVLRVAEGAPDCGDVHAAPELAARGERPSHRRWTLVADGCLQLRV